MESTSDAPAALRDISPVPVVVSDEPVATGGSWIEIERLDQPRGALKATSDVFTTLEGHGLAR